MPLAKIHVLEGQYDKARLGKLSEAIQNALIEVLGVHPTTSFRSITSCRAIAIAIRRPFSDRNTPMR
jgi:hypothetical protein